MVGIRMKTVMVNGTFDVLHPGHVALLNTARSYGDHLIVAIDTDRRVRELKGEQRPINNQYDRRIMLANLKAVDIVEFFDSKEELITLMQRYQPDIYVKGSDWKHDTESTAHQYSKKVIYYDRIEPYSTTKTIQDIIDRG
jgi:D-beta-D-heptose 7-phosphate kinase/D-beta-D-heptose 1-phosphate adenosyltransferase